MKPSYRPPVLCFAVLLVAAGVFPARAEIWLTPAEQQLIAALGLDAKIDGKSVRRKPNLESLVEIGNRSPEPLKSRILAMAQAYPKFDLSPQQIEELQAIMQRAAEESQKVVRGAALKGLESPNLTERERIEHSAKLVNSLLEDKDGPFRTMIRKATGWYREQAAARETVAKNMDLVTAEFDKRVSQMRPASDLSLALAGERGGLVITGKVGPTPLTAAVVQVVVHKDVPEGSWQGFSQGMSQWAQSLGVTNLGEGKAGEESKAQSAALEKLIALPNIKLYGLPKLNAGSRFTIDLDEDLNEVIYFKSVSLKAWTAEGTIAIDSIPSMADMQKLREDLPHDELFKDTAAAQPAEVAAATPEKNTGKATSRKPEPRKKESRRPQSASDDPAGRAFGQPRERTPVAESPSGTVPRGFGQPREREPESAGGALVPPAFGGGTRNPDPDRESTADARARARREAAQEQQALAALNLARTALKRKQDDQARVYLKQTIALAPDSPAADTAKKLLKGLDK